MRSDFHLDLWMLKRGRGCGNVIRDLDRAAHLADNSERQDQSVGGCVERRIIRLLDAAAGSFSKLWLEVTVYVRPGLGHH